MTSDGESTGAASGHALTESPYGRLLAFWPGGSTATSLPSRGVVTIGRSPSSTLTVPHRSVSRQHAIVHVDGGIEIEDLGSANGTKIDGKQLARGSRGALEAGAILEIGDVTIFLQLPSPERDADPAPTPMVDMRRRIAIVARSRISVLLLGETGVGKGVAAVEIHQMSGRGGPLVAFNCAAIADSLLEAELFGHEKGAFTGAVTARAGLIESADGGTVFLDEIGEVPPSTQVKLLRVLESREVLRVGGRKGNAFDVRFVSATHRDLEEMVRAGAFREDLYFRLNGFSLPILPLRARVNEIPALAAQFAREEAGGDLRLSREAFLALEQHPWPGNIRELRNVVVRAVLLAAGGEIRVEHLGLPHPAAATGKDRPREESLERRRIEAALAASSGNQTRAAQTLGLSRRTFLRRLEEYCIPRPRK